MTAHLDQRGLTVARVGATVRVSYPFDLDERSREWFRHVLFDLIDGQGNLSLDVRLPAVTRVDLPLLDVLIAAEERQAARGGSMCVTTKTGRWPETHP